MTRVLAVSPRPQVSGASELAVRWDVSRVTVNTVVNSEGFPEPTLLSTGRVWADEDVAAWEAAERAAGRALPGETGFGPRPGTGGRPKRKPAADT